MTVQPPLIAEESALRPGQWFRARTLPGGLTSPDHDDRPLLCLVASRHDGWLLAANAVERYLIDPDAELELLTPEEVAAATGVGLAHVRDVQRRLLARTPYDGQRGRP